MRDNGPGVPRDAMPRLFEPFFTSDGVQGSGLGLAIAHELAERMRGRLYAESVPGRTVFTLELTADRGRTAGHGGGVRYRPGACCSPSP